MGKSAVKGKELIKLGYPGHRSMGLAIQQVLQFYKREKREALLQIFKDVLARPEEFESHPVLGNLVAVLKGGKPLPDNTFLLLETQPSYPIFGKEGIEKGAIDQMEIAMRLPVAVKGALMPDAHQGYGLPIGGVLATKNAVIPYGVGVDIGCRMCLSVFPLPSTGIELPTESLKSLLEAHTRFGYDAFEKPMDDEVLHVSEFKELGLLKSLKPKAVSQIGSSGSGNHFVEFGLVELPDAQNEWGLPAGTYLGLLSHSGSRGLGANVAKHYTKLAIDTCRLPKHAKNLAWLDLDSEAGAEYWMAMNVAGQYASACHHHIHQRIAKALGENPLFRVENHHNFAWKEQLSDGTEVVVHRKGATPAHKGALGIIPGSMTLPGFIVRGKGDAESLNSASHGAGRLLSRTQAMNSITQHELNKMLEKKGVVLIGGGLDEAPIAYKNIWEVMESQRDLVEVLGTFQPKVVRMAE
ncbi:MAG: RtcB family protein [Saprospirales bacterium]|nr:RtcB family protein [Saprospirales bacterium]